jgi:hypothetical protein
VRLRVERDTRIAGRYRVEAILGRGGMGAVYRVVDESSGKPLALKLLHIEAGDPKAERAAALFEREYHALEQLAHPRVIAVHDYGVVQGTPYYTMELLDGKDLRELAPVPWQQACALLRDVASSLAILHSRRMVHRDLSPRNVRCTSDGRAKLLDFGAMGPMGPLNQVVGTPAYMAPDIVAGADVDGRADLFSLGALAYWTLTARHAYPARQITDLKDVWRHTPAPPSSEVAAIPTGLDELVMAMMSMDPLARPQNAAEVIDRLTALAALEPQDQLGVAQAYLSTPALVAREELRERFRRRVQRATRGRGGSLMVEARPGMGRTRLLGAFLLEAKLGGAVAVRAGADDQHGLPLGLIRVLARSLLELAPALCREAAEPEAEWLAVLVPELVEVDADDALPPEARDPFGEPVQNALVRWLLRMAERRCVVLCIDDLERCDTASVAVLVRLATQAGQQPIVLVTSVALRDDAALSRAVEQIAAAGSQLTLSRLDEAQSHALIASVFGEVSHLEVVASWIFGLARGNPRMTMELAQFLVDRSLARFSDGSWVLPEELRDQDLPLDLGEALERRFAGLGSTAQQLARLLALVTPDGRLSLADYPRVFAGRFEPGAVFAALDELVTAQMVVRQGDDYAFRERALERVVERNTEPALRGELHAALAELYATREGLQMVRVHHLFEGGAHREAIDLLMARAAGITDIASTNSVFLRSRIGVRLLEQAIDASQSLGYPPVVTGVLRRNMLGIASATRPDKGTEAGPLLEQLRRDSGLAYLDAVDASLSPSERIAECLRRAQQAYASGDPARRGFAPVQAIREIALASNLVAGIAVRALDVATLNQLPEIVEPLVPLSPAIQVLHQIIVLARDAVVYGADVHQPRLAMRSVLSRPLDGVDDIMRQGTYHIYSFYSGLELATLGDPEALRVADDLPATGTHAALAWQVRKLYYQYVGQREQSEHCRRRMDILSLGHVEAEGHLVVSLVFELGIVASTGDLLDVKRLWRQFQREAALYPGWRPVERLAAANYGLLRGDFAGAERAVREGLALVGPLEHLMWRPLQSTLAHVLVAAGRYREALGVGVETRAAFERKGKGPPVGTASFLEVPMAMAEARLGLAEEAVVRLDTLLGSLAALSPTWVPRGVAHEERARLALLIGDRIGYEDHAAAAAAIYRPGKMPGLARRYEQLMAEARRGVPGDDGVGQARAMPSAPSVPSDAHDTPMDSSVNTLLGACHGPEERARHALDLLLDDSGASAGYLFAMSHAGPSLVAQFNAGGSEPALDAQLDRYLAQHLEEPAGSTPLEIVTQAGSDPSGWVLSDGLTYFPFILRVYRQDQLRVGALALLALPSAEVPTVSGDLLGALADALLDAGDVTALSSMYVR